MPTVPKIRDSQTAVSDSETQVQERPSPKLAKSTPEERERDNPRLSVYDDLIRATAHLPAAERMAARLPAIMSDPAAWGAGQDLERVVRDKVPSPEETNA
jgi:hypothetical protein